MLGDGTVAECFEQGPQENKGGPPSNPESIKMYLCSPASLLTSTLEKELSHISKWFSDHCLCSIVNYNENYL